MAESGVSALAGLFDLTSQRLVRYSATITRNQHDAEDAVQAALVRVAGHVSLLCQADYPWPYLLRMVRNEALVIVRRKRRWSPLANLSDLLTRRLVDELEQEESHRAVWSALRSLLNKESNIPMDSANYNINVREYRIHAGILAINHGVPERVQTAEELAPLIGMSPQWIREHAGVHRRHTSSPSDDPAVLAASVAQPIVERFGEPDLILHAGVMQRQLLPDMSVFIARELGLSRVPGFTVNATCLSFLVALRTATALVCDGSYRQVLICSSEFGTRGRNFNEPESAALIGDAAAVALVGQTNEEFGILHYAMETWPEGAELAEVRGAGVMYPPNDKCTNEEDNLFHMQGGRMLRFIVPKLQRFMTCFLADCGLTLNDIDLIVPHQTSASGMRVLDRLGFPKSKVVNILADYGNCVAASIPLALSIAEHSGRIKQGDQVLLIGTAAGLSIGAALIRW